MNKKLALFGVFTIVTLVGIGMTIFLNPSIQKTEEDHLNIVTSFYPVYIGAFNVIDGIKGVELINLTENQGGCLHDYTLNTQDMKCLENADVLIINGGGMEAFVMDIIKKYPHVQIIDSSVGTSSLENDFEHEDSHSEEGNSHFWMNPEIYILQIKNIVDGLSKVDENNKKTYEKNGTIYIEKIQSINQELDGLSFQELESGVIIFHDAFAYLADRLKIPVIHCVDMDEDTSLSAGEVAHLMEEGKEKKVKYIFTEKQFRESLPKTVAEEIEATLCSIDSLVSGPMDKDAYINGMMENINALKEVLY